MYVIGVKIGNKEKKVSVGVVMARNIKIMNNLAWFFLKTLLADYSLKGFCSALCDNSFP